MPMQRSKTWRIILPLVLLIGFCYWLSGRVPYQRTESFRVPLQLYEVSPQVTRLKNWPKWFATGPDVDDTTGKEKQSSDSLLDLGHERVRMLASNPTSMQLLWEKNGRSYQEDIRLSSDSFGNATRVDWTERMDLRERVGRIFGNGGEQDLPVNRFRSFVLDPERYFGFGIH